MPVPPVRTRRREAAMAASAPGDDRLVRLARSAALESGRVEAGSGVRREIAESWHRSLMCDVRPGADLAPSYARVDPDSGFAVAAAPVVGAALDELADLWAGIVITDPQGRILRRWAADSAVARQLDRVHAVPGVSLSEADVGTNAVGMAQETRRPALVQRSEHLFDGYGAFACAAVPVRHPGGGRVVGILDVAVRATEGQGALLLAWAVAVAKEIEAKLLSEAGRDTRILVDRYVSHTRGARHRPVLVVGEEMIISTPTAARLLGKVDQTLLWEQAARVLHGGQDTVCPITLPDGRTVSAHCRPVGADEGGRLIGALLDLTVQAPEAPTAIRRGRPRSAPADSGFRSAAWRRAWAQAVEGRDANQTLLLRGEPGTAKRALAEHLFGDRPVHVIDAAVTLVDGFVTWANQLRELLTGDRRAVVVLHAEQLRPDQARTVQSLLGSRGGAVHAVLAVTDHRSGGGPASALTTEFTGCTVSVPPLRERIDDLSDLLARMSQDATGRPREWLSEAVQALSGLDWPGNLRQLRGMVATVTANHPVGAIGLRQLPVDLLSAVPRRPFTELQQLERHAILTALQRSAGNKAEAASALQMSRSTFYRRLRSLGIAQGWKAF